MAHPVREMAVPTAVGDKEVASCLRSEQPLVVVEAPAGCGKTHQGSLYAAEAGRSGRGRVLVLTHTHAAADEFISRAEETSARVDVRTIDSLIVEIAGAYHMSLGLPDDVGKWASREPDGFQQAAQLVARLMEVAAGPGRALARRYPVVIFDEHQDASDAQAAVLDAMLRAGARVRVFGDPMQIIYPDADVETEWKRWEDLCGRASQLGVLATPHRWMTRNEELGDWVFKAREALRTGDPIDLRGRLPAGLEVHWAEDRSSRWDGYQTSTKDGRPIRELVELDEVLFLAARNPTVRALRPYFFRRVPVWEGHTRDALGTLVKALEGVTGDPHATAQAFVTFVQDVAVGFSNSVFAGRLLDEVRQGCRKSTQGKPRRLQDLGRCLLRSPDHRGVSNALRLLWHLSRTDAAFSPVKIDHVTEFWDAVRLGSFEDPRDGFGEIAQRRTWSRPSIPARALSTIHKAKGLECACVVIMPCDSDHFRGRLKDRCALYVALSRARERLALVIPRSNPSPLFKIR